MFVLKLSNRIGTYPIVGSITPSTICPEGHEVAPRAMASSCLKVELACRKMVMTAPSRQYFQRQQRA
jgi:hypothetical protein